MNVRIRELENRLKNLMFSDADIALLSSFSGNFNEKNAEILTKDLDIDNGNYLYLLMLGIIGLENGWIYFPQDMIPRIQGIHRYEQVKNSSTVPWFANQISVLKDAGIPVMFSGNTAVRYAFLPSVTRFIRGFDVTVPSKDYDRAVELLRSEIKAADKSDFRNRTIDDMTEIHLHKGVHDKRLFDEETFWSTSHDVEFQTLNVKAPSLEIQLLSCLCVPYGHFLAREKKYDRIYRLVSTLQMLKYKTVDIDKIAFYSKRKNINCQLRLQLSLILPFSNALNEADLDSIADEKEYGTYLSKLNDYLDHPSVQKEYQLINSCFRSEERKVSFSKYVADTRKIHSLTDLGRYVGKRSRSKKNKDGNHDNK